MSRSIYEVTTEGVVASAAATTAKTILGAKAHANSGLDLLGFWIDFDGTTASEKPVLVECAYCTWATNGPGTNSTSVTPIQASGRVLTAGFTAAKTWTSEPTALTSTIFRAVDLDPNKGLYHYDWPLGETPDCALAEGFVIRCTVPSGGAAVNYRAGMRLARN